MSDLLAGTGWIGEHPVDGSDVAHLLLYPATAFDPDTAVKVAALAVVWGMVDATAGEPVPTPDLWVDADARVLHQPGMTTAFDAPVDWWTAATAHGLVVVSLTSLPLSAPGLPEVDVLMETAGRAEVWCAFAEVRGSES